MSLPQTAEPRFAGLGPYTILERGRITLTEKKRENNETKLGMGVNT